MRGMLRPGTSSSPGWSGRCARAGRTRSWRCMVSRGARRARRHGRSRRCSTPTRCRWGPAIPERERRTEAEYWREFERARPAVLGALYDAVSAALRNEATTRLASRPRMADFAEWVSAAEPALGWPPGAFLSAYDDNR